MATLILEDGTRYTGTLFGHKAPVTGEVVFTTGMTGYQETLTDPSYCGQIVCMTYPLIGNVGVNDIDNESAGVKMRGFIVSELCDVPSNWQMKKTLDQYLDEQGVTGLYGVDTRALTKHVRVYGTLRGRIVEGEATEADLELAKSFEMHDQVAQCTCKEAYKVPGEGKYHIAVMDFGLKRGILRSLHDRGCSLTVFPADTPASEILASGCDGVMLTKLDGDARGGAALSIRASTGKPIKFVGTGEKLDMIEPFHPDRMASRILGMGDMLSFIEKAQQNYDEKQAAKLEEKLRKNRLTLQDYYEQLQQLRNMGDLSQLAGMMPGNLGRQMAGATIDDKALAHTEAIILSMTPQERENPQILNASRKKRIAAGCGLQVVDVNRLLKQFEMMQQLTKQMTRGRLPRMGGGGMGGRMHGFGRKKRLK